MCDQAHPDASDPPSFGFEHLDVQSVELKGLADERDAPDTGQQVAANSLESLGLDTEPQPIDEFVEVDSSEEQATA